MKNLKGSNQFKKQYQHGGKWTALVGYLFFVWVLVTIGMWAKYESNRQKLPGLVFNYIPQVQAQEATPSAQLLTRESRLQSFLESKNSPLAEYSDYIVERADAYGIDYTLIVSISGKESSFGKNIKPGSNNAWGVMTWDAKGNRSIRSFGSWKEGIDYESRLLGESYRFNANLSIGAKYCPAFECSSTWAEDVTSFSEELLSFGGGEK